MREYLQDSWNIVLHSDCPHIAPHIVITPAQETADDFYTPWMNRTQPQWTGSLMVPPCNLATGRLHAPNFPAQPNIPCSIGDSSIDCGSQVEDTTCSPIRVFSRAQFSSFVSISPFQASVSKSLCESPRSSRPPTNASYYTMWPRRFRNTSARLQ